MLAAAREVRVTSSAPEAPTSRTVEPSAPPRDLLDLVLASLDTAVGVLRAPDFRYELANPACQVVIPGPPFVGRTFAEIAPELAPTVLPLLRRVAETGEPFRAVDMRLDLASGPGGALEERYFTFTYQRLPPDRSGWPAVLATVTETTARVREHRELERTLAIERSAREWLERFRALSTALAAARTAAEVARATLDHGLPAFGADAGWIVVPDGLGALQSLATAGYAVAQAVPWERFPVAAEVPIADAFRTGAAVYLEDRSALQARYPALASSRSGWLGLAALPLLVDGRPVGAIGLSYRAPRPFDPAERSRLEWLAQKCGQALDRAHLFDAEQRALHWLERLQAATAAASAAATPAEVADEVIRAGLHALGAASVVVFGLEPPATLRAVASYGLAPAALERLSPMPLEAHLPSAEAARTRAAVLAGTPEAIAEKWPGLRALPAGGPERALAVLPMLARGEMVGVLRVGFAESRRFDAGERAFLDALASQAALALERARGYQAEQRAREEATRVGALQERLLAVVGHDLRTPLTAVLATAALLTRRGGLSPEQAVAVERIDRGARRLASIIRDLLDFTRARQGLALALRPEPVDLGEVARTAVQELEAGGAVDRVTLRVDGAAGLRADPGRLTQAVSNLVGNALQHGGGSRVEVVVTGREDEVGLEVRNGGRPIPPEVLPHLFEPFRRGTAEHASGSIGLGLFIAREIVQAHGGTVELRSSAEAGTCATLRLPRAGPPGVAAEKDAAAGTGAATG